jgi:ribosomal protein S18 acetylase RimI-like enzyme
MSLHIAPLGAADAPAYRQLMLEAYVQAADAFTSTAEERAAEPLAWWVQRIGTAGGPHQCFGAFEHGRLVGTVGLEFASKPKTRHSALVIGMYVQPAARRLGAGRALLQALLAAAAARPGLLLLRLTVTEGNEAAIGLYQSVGFVAWGVEPLAIRTPSGYKGKVHMVLRLASPTPTPGASSTPPGAVAPP